MKRDLTPEAKFWCLAQSIAVVKAAGHGGDTICGTQLERCKVFITLCALCALRRDALEAG